MLRNFIFTLFFAVAFAGTIHAANIDLATIENTDAVPDQTSENTYLYSSNGVIAVGLDGKAIEVGSHLLSIGGSSAGAGVGFTLTLGGITTSGVGSTVTINPANSSTVTLNSSLNLNAGGIANFGVNGGTVIVNGATLSADGFGAATLNVNNNSTVTFTGVTGDSGGVLGGSNAVTVNLNGGKLGFGSTSLTLAHGSINVKQTSQLGVNGALIVNNETSAASASLNIDAGKQLTLVKELGNTANLASLTIGGSGGGTLTMGGSDATLTVDKLTLADGATFFGSVAGNIKANTLDVLGDFKDEINVKTTVTGLTTIDYDAEYVVAGVNNVYSGGMLVHGLLKGDASATKITLGNSVTNRALLQIDGGGIAAGAGGLTIDYAHIDIINASATGLATIDASEGRLNLDTSIITVNLSGDPTATIKADKGISVEGYFQHTGNVNISTVNGGKMVVKETAAIGSDLTTSQVALDVSGHAVQFAGGLILNDYGAVTAVNASGTVDIGSAAGNATIISTGNNQLLAGEGKILTFNKMGSAAGTMTWQGTGNTVIGEVDQSQFGVTVNAGAELEVGTYAAADAKGYQVGSLNIYGKLGMIQEGYGVSASVITSSGNVVVKSGGVLTADYAQAVNDYAYIVNAGSSANVLRVDNGGVINPNTSTIYAENFKSVEINGNFIAGLLDDSVVPVEAARLMANSDVNIGSTGLITLSADLAKVVTAADNADEATKLIQVEGAGNTITNNGNMSSNSMLGKFEYALNENDTILYVSDVKDRVSLDGTDEDRKLAWDNLRDLWCKDQFNYDFSNVIYDVLKGDITVEPEDSVAGNKNKNLLEAIAVPEGKVVGVDTLEYVNGAHLYGITDVAVQTNRTFMSDVTMRAKAMMCQFVADAGNAAGSSDALATTAMNVYKLNRFWFGGSALRQYADQLGCFSGYKYKAHGFSGGLDRVAWQNVAIGGAFAFNRGDYEDKSAADHDSKIESFTAGAYATYSSPCSGWFFTGHGAYTYSQNDIRELRRDPDAGRHTWGESSFHTNTWSVGALFGYDFRLVEDGFALTPSIGFNYITAANSDHDSLLDGVATQRITDAKNTHVYVPLDFTVQYERCLGPNSSMRLEGNVGYAYNLRQSGMTGDVALYDLGPAASFGIHGRENSRHTYKAGVGARYRYREFDIGVRYDIAGQEGYRGHRLMASAGLSF